MAGRRKKSKKRSVASSGLRPEVTVFVDECLGRYAVPDALRRAGVTVVCHYELFPAGAEDKDWLQMLANRPECLVFTKDSQIRRRPLEILAYRRAGLRVFALTSGNLTGDEQARAFVRALPKIRRLAGLKGPFIARVLASGTASLIGERSR